jgi:four helix bundle protein
MAFMFEKLDVYQKSIDLAERILVATSEFPRGFYFLADQLNRASVSIAANIAEGNGRFTVPDRKHFFMIARGSVQECVALMEIARRRKLVTLEAHVQLRMELEEISKMLSGLINGLENRKA